MSELFYSFYFIYLIWQYIVDVDMVQGRGGGMSSVIVNAWHDWPPMPIAMPTMSNLALLVIGAIDDC